MHYIIIFLETSFNVFCQIMWAFSISYITIKTERPFAGYERKVVCQLAVYKRWLRKWLWHKATWQKEYSLTATPTPFPRAADLLLSKEASPLPAHMTADYYINLFSCSTSCLHVFNYLIRWYNSDLWNKLKVNILKFSFFYPKFLNIFIDQILTFSKSS